MCPTIRYAHHPICLMYLVINFDDPAAGKKRLGQSNGKGTAKIQTHDRITTSFSVGDLRHNPKLGCLTCKVRRKRCNDQRPECSGCKKVRMDCVWIDYEKMSKDDIRRLRREVAATFNERRTRTRKAKPTEVSGEQNMARPDSDEEDLAPEDAEDSDQVADLKVLEQPETITALSPIPNHVLSPQQLLLQDNATLILLNMQDRVAHHYGASGAEKPGFMISSPTSPAVLDEEQNSSPSGGILSLLKEYSQFRGSNANLPERSHSNDLQLMLPQHFNLPSFMESVLSAGTPEQLSSLASSFNAVFSPAPEIPITTLPGLDESGVYLYNYYVDTLSWKVSIAPRSQNEGNSFQKVFLPLAQEDNGTLFGILAWAGYHLGGRWMELGRKYADLAVEQLRRESTDRRTTLNKLATILILCGAEICRGDVKLWLVYLDWGSTLLKKGGGILNFDGNKEEHWLISNFAYHDIMASSTCERGTYFSMDVYDTIFKDERGVSVGHLNPLLGVNKCFYKIIGDINSLSYASNLTPDLVISPDDAEGSEYSDMSEHGLRSLELHKLVERALEIDHMIDTCRPEPSDLVGLDDSELELQLTSFEGFQLSCKLYLRQLILRCNPSSIESQILNNDLIKCIEILLPTFMHATLVFPIFMAGVHAVTSGDRKKLIEKVDAMMKIYGPWNVVRVKLVLTEIWDRNPSGDTVVDWIEILREFGWELNFA